MCGGRARCYTTESAGNLQKRFSSSSPLSNKTQQPASSAPNQCPISTFEGGGGALDEYASGVETATGPGNVQLMGKNAYTVES